jgi:hypothetical protein
MTKPIKTLCSVADCVNIQTSLGKCKKHYLIWWRKQNPEKYAAARKRAIDRVKVGDGRQIIRMRCPRCDTIKLADNFRKCSSKLTGLSSYCIPCEKSYYNAYRKKRRAAQTSEERYIDSRKSSLKTMHDLTVEQYDLMLSSQNEKCAICGSKDSGRKGRTAFKMYVDHCHETGRIRGLLCSSCNLGLGKFKDDPDRLMVAAAYLLQHSTGEAKASD